MTESSSSSEASVSMTSCQRTVRKTRKVRKAKRDRHVSGKIHVVEIASQQSGQIFGVASEQLQGAASKESADGEIVRTNAAVIAEAPPLL